MGYDHEQMDQIDDDVPVYEALYPELEEECSHPKCSDDSPPRSRLCDECTPIMRREAPDECSFCGQERQPS